MDSNKKITGGNVNFMVSKFIEHLEHYNKEINLKAYYDKLHQCKKPQEEMNEKEFYKCLLQASLEGVTKSHNLNGKHVDIDKATNEIMQNEYMQAELFKNYSVMVIINEWLRYKQIYSFDKDTLNLLISNEASNLSYEELKALKMPFETLVIENEIDVKGSITDSVIVSKRYRPKFEDVVLSIYGFSKIEPDDTTKMLRLDILISNNQDLFETIEKHDEETREFVCKVMNLVLYLCQSKIDVVYKKSEKKPVKQGMPKHFYSVDYDSNEVGCRLGSAIRKYRYVYESTGHKHTGGTKKPHIRSGHYHRYWVGKGRTDLIIKYVEPVFVLGGNKNATMHNVK